MGILDDKIAMVTGAAKGIGLAIARALSERGRARRALRHRRGGRRVRRGGSAAGRGRRLRRHRRGPGRRASCSGTVERHGRLDVMVANAGIATVAPLAQMPLEEWRRVLSVDLDGVFLCTKHAGAAMAAAGGGSIINIASIKAFGGAPGDGPLRRREGGRRLADQDRGDRAARPRRAGQRDLPGMGGDRHGHRPQGGARRAPRRRLRRRHRPPPGPPRRARRDRVRSRCSSPRSAPASRAARPSSSTAARPPRWSSTQGRVRLGGQTPPVSSHCKCAGFACREGVRRDWRV